MLMFVCVCALLCDKVFRLNQKTRVLKDKFLQFDILVFICPVQDDLFCNQMHALWYDSGMERLLKSVPGKRRVSHRLQFQPTLQRCSMQEPLNEKHAALSTFVTS